MTYIVEVTAEYKDVVEDVGGGIPRLIYRCAFGDEGDARSALSRFLDDNESILKISNRFRPEYLTACIRYRGEFSDFFEDIFLETIII